MTYYPGTGGVDTLNGTDADDTFRGFEGNDTLNGGGGNDTFYISGSNFGVDTINGGTGEDEIRLDGNVNANIIDFSSAKITSVETLALGNYSLNGTAGNDSFNLSGILGISSNGLMALGEGDDTFVGHVGTNSVDGGSGNDRLDGGAGNDFLTGGDGNDTLIGGSGNDTFYIYGSNFGRDTYNGGDGEDEIRLTGNVAVSYVDFSSSKANLVETLALGNYSLNGTVGDDSFNLSGIQGISSNDTMSLGDGNDTFVGHVGTNYVDGGSGNDRLDGGAGNDFLTGGDGNDILIGGSGNDTFYIYGSNFGRDTYNGGDGEDEIRLTGNVAVSYVDFSSSKANLVETLALGNYSLNGTVGDDSFNLSGIQGISSNDTMSLGDGNDTFVGHVGANYVDGGSGNDSLDGRAGNDELYGAEGNDTLIGGTGVDEMTGGTGNDTYYVDNAGDQTIEANGGGSDRVYSSVSYSVSRQFIENIYLTGSGHINATGNNLANGIVGNGGNNSIDGGAGADYMVGGLGNDTYYVDNAGDRTIEANGGGSDRVYSSVSYSIATQFIENIYLTGSGNLSVTGNNLANGVVGNSGNNVLNGGLGSDYLVGGAGNDFFTFNTALGASNVDTINDFNVAQDTIRADNAIFTALGGAGTLAASAFHIGASAHDANDRIIYNSSTGALYYDADGSGSGAAVQFASLTKGLALTNADFLVV